MPDTRLILHVRGTEGDTTELRKEEVRAALSSNQITQSQLIWSPTDHAWKQARDFPELALGERLILHVKGTEAETTELSKDAVRVAISEGKISHSQLIWSPADHAWKQVKEWPDLLPVPAATMTPVPRVVAVVAESPARFVSPLVEPVASGTSADANIPFAPPARVAVVPAQSPQVRVSKVDSVPSRQDFMVEKQKEESHPLKWVCIFMGALILLVLGANWCLVDQPLASNLGETEFSNVPVHAHLAAFVQPNVLMIHIPVTATVTPARLPKFFVALAHATPPSPITRTDFARIALTSGWEAQYSFSGFSWKELGDMGGEAPDQLKEFLLDQMDDAGGQPVVSKSSLNETLQQARRDKIWNDFVKQFTKN